MENTDDRLKHVMGVAEKMRKYAPKFGVKPEDAFVLGTLHDICHEFEPDSKKQNHNHKGALVLRNQGYIYWKEVYYHGAPQYKFDFPMLRLLNFADMTTGPAGEDMTVREKIMKTIEKYGKDSQQANDMRQMSKFFR